MNTNPETADDDRILVPVMMNQLDAARLMELADIRKESLAMVIAAIVHDVLEDDAVMHGELPDQEYIQ